MSGTLTNQVAIVTGAAQGLGAAICERLREEQAIVVPADIKGFDTAVDVTKEEDVAALFDNAVKQHGKVDIVVANAAILIAEPIAEADAEKWRAVMNVNLFGNFLTMKHACRVMKPLGHGSIIQINSKSGKKGSAANSAYAASKFGGIGFTQSIALELAEFGVRVNAVCPGNLLDSPLWVDSLFEQYAERLDISPEEVRRRYIDQVPMKRGCSYQDVANLVVYLASDQSSYMTGQAINVTGGQEMR